jgi:hypothetical protein
MMETKRSRIQVEVSSAAKQRLEALMQESGASNEAEVIRLALWAYDQLMGVQRADGEVRIARKDGTFERLKLVQTR